MNRLSVLVLGLAFLLALPAGAAESCAWEHVDLRGGWGSARFGVEVADTPDSRATGLMHRENLPPQRGMLFVFESPGEAAFWMKNTLIPLDMLFFDDSGVLVSLRQNTVPLSTELISGGEQVLAVLEINAGIAGRYGIKTGTEIRHPSLDKSKAAWPCGGNG